MSLLLVLEILYLNKILSNGLEENTSKEGREQRRESAGEERKGGDFIHSINILEGLLCASHHGRFYVDRVSLTLRPHPEFTGKRNKITIMHKNLSVCMQRK